MKYMKYLICVVLMLGVSGCAALFGAKEKTFDLRSDPEGAEVYLNGNRLGTTPVQARLSNLATHTFVFRKDGYKESSCTLARGTGGGWVILDILGGPLIDWSAARRGRDVALALPHGTI